MEKRVFEFTNYDVPVVIAGHEFTLNCGTDTGDYLKSVGAELKKLAAEIGAGSKSTSDAVAYCKGAIDKLLGDGAAETIMAGRKENLSDAIDVCLFLIQTAAAFGAERRRAQGNRAQHRRRKHGNGKR